MAISNSMAAAAAAAATSPMDSATLSRTDHAVSQVAQHIFGEFHVHFNPDTSDVHIVHASQVANVALASQVSHLAQACLSHEQVHHKQQLASGGEQKIRDLDPKIQKMERQIQEIGKTIAGLEKEIADCDVALAQKPSKTKSAELQNKKTELEERKSRWGEEKTKLLREKDGLVAIKKQLEEGVGKANQALRQNSQITHFHQNLQEKLVEAGARYEALGCIEQDGKVVIVTEQGRYDVGLSPAALKMMIAVSLITEDVAKDRIIRVHTSAPGTTDLDTHDFYQISQSDSSAAQLVHKHGTSFGSGGKGSVYKTFEFLSKEVRILKVMRDNTPEEMKLEYTMSCVVNPDNMRPGLAHKPHACFELSRDGFGGVGLIFDLYNKGDICNHLPKLTPQDQARGILAIFEANQSLSARQLLHHDIKPENVFLHEGSGGLEMVVADFDGVWKLGLSPGDLIELFDEKPVPEASPNSRTGEQTDRLIELKRKTCDLYDACQEAGIDPGERKQMEKNLSNLVESYKVTATCVQNWGAAYTALQVITGTYSQSCEKDLGKLLAILESKRVRSSSPEEKKFLLQVQGVLMSILNAPLPTIDERTGKITDKHVHTPDEALKFIKTHAQAFLGVEDTSAAAAAAAASPESSAEGKRTRRMSVSDAVPFAATASIRGARRNSSPPPNGVGETRASSSAIQQ